MINTKILKVSIEYEDKILTVEGKEAEKWGEHNLAVAQLAQLHGMNPFLSNPIQWQIKPASRSDLSEPIIHEA